MKLTAAMEAHGYRIVAGPAAETEIMVGWGVGAIEVR
jgi:hypothetical protein